MKVRSSKVDLSATEVTVTGTEQEEREAPATRIQRQLSLYFHL